MFRKKLIWDLFTINFKAEKQLRKFIFQIIAILISVKDYKFSIDIILNIRSIDDLRFE